MTKHTALESWKMSNESTNLVTTAVSICSFVLLCACLVWARRYLLRIEECREPDLDGEEWKSK